MNKTLKGTQINGPINIVRLEGEVNGVKKVLHVFFDNHSDLQNQTECPGVDNIDVHHFFRTEFNKLDKSKNYDFFLEDFPSLLYRDKFMYREKYISQVRKLFRQKRKSYDNVRFHYIDIRDYLYPISVRQFIYSKVHTIDNTTTKNLLNALQQLTIFLNKLHKFSHNPTKQKKKDVIIKSDKEYYEYTSQNLDDITSNLLHKTKYKYNDKQIQKNMNYVFEKMFINSIKDLLTLCKEYKKFLLENDKIIQDDLIRRLRKDKDGLYYYSYNFDNLDSIILKINEYLRKISNKFITVGSSIVDIFFLRRFLDKKYITTAISYTGWFHSMRYILILVKYYDFQIRETSYINTKNNIHKMLKKHNINNINDLAPIFIPPILNQCSTFPSDSFD